MKAFAFVLLCALAAVQGRYHDLQSTRSAAALGENPWVVHLRIAVSTSGLLESCIGSLIDNRWVLTSRSCVADARFIWIRYGAVNVINPSLVTEATLVRVTPTVAVGLININRYVEATDNIAPISALGAPGNSGKFCVYGGDDDEDGPGEQLNCYDVGIQQDGQTLHVSSDEFVASKYDLGSPLVSNGAQVGILVGPGSEDSPGEFVTTAQFGNWFVQEGVPVSSDVASEAVNFV